MKLQVEKPPEEKKMKKTKNSEKKRRKTNTKNSSSLEKKRRKTNTKISLPSSFSLLPNELMVNCLARVPISYYPRLSIVSKSFKSLLSSTDLYVDRSNLGITEQCHYVCLWDDKFQSPKWFRLWNNPKRTLHGSSVTKKTNKQTGQVLVPIPSPKFPSTSKSIVVVGYEVYVIGGPVNHKRSSVVQILDCRSHTWRKAPRMNVARKNAASCFYDGKIYVMGGCERLKDDEPWAEVFDTKTHTWEWFLDPGRIPNIEEIERKIYVGNVDNLYAYNTKQGKWELCENRSAAVPWSECMIENVPYTCYRNNIWLCNINNGYTEVVKGLDSLVKKYINGGPSTSKLVSCGGKLLLTWEEYIAGEKKIWCAEIVLEKRDGGEVWGNIEWADVVHIVPTSWRPLHWLTVSI